MEINKIIDEVAQKHHLILSKDDPILAMVTINELILKQYITDMQLQLDITQDKITAAFEQQVADSKKAASALITNTSIYMTDHVKQAILTIKNDLVMEIKNDLLAITSLRNDAKKLNTYTISVGIALSIFILFAFIMAIII